MSEGISFEKFKEKLKVIADLTGQRVSLDTVRALWERLGEKVDWADFDKATEDMANSDIKITLGALNQHIWKYQTKRLEEENRLQKYKEEQEVKEWFNAHRGTKDTCVNISADGSSRCYDCKRIYCNIVGAATCEALKTLFTRENVNVQDIHRGLAEKFKGIGFEDNVPESQAF